VKENHLESIEKFVTTINCIDGRVQLPVIKYLMEETGADYIDIITEPGPNKILSENIAVSTVTSIRNRVAVSVDKHLSELIAIIGHHDCSGNPAEREEQIQQIHKSCKLVQEWQADIKIIGLWVDKHWTVNMV
jgi:hypothetical protein